MRLRPARWPLAAQVLHRAELLDRAIQATGADPAAVVRKDGGSAFAQARVTCLHCRYGRACQSWLDAADHVPADFCPNAGFLHQLALSGVGTRIADRDRRRPLD
jgi:hypothetical protein